MSKQEFLNALRKGLSGLPQEDVTERLSFYEEMIDDRIEDGLSEEEAVAQIAPVGDIVAQVLSETPLTKIVKERVRTERRPSALTTVLLILGFPLWFPLLIAGFAVLISVYAVIWSVIVSLWAVDLSLAGGSLAGAAAGVVLLIRGNAGQGLVLISSCLVLAGLAILMFFACRALTVLAVRLTKKIALWIKSLFLRKEEEK